MATAQKQVQDQGNGDIDQPEGWRPEPGDEIVGKIVDVSAATSTQRNQAGEFPQYPLLRIEREDGTETFVHCFHQTLQRALLESRPEIGHRVRIRFHGKRALKSDPSRSVAIYSMDLPDTPKTAASIYDKLERAPARRSAPGTPASDADLPWDEDDVLG